MPTFLTLLSACIAPPPEDRRRSPSQPKPPPQLFSGDKDIPISKINLGPGQEDLTSQPSDDYHSYYDPYYIST